jgi:hypothetical protein
MPGRELPWSKSMVAVLVLALTAASVLLRIYGLRFHYWVDEGISVGISSHPLSQLPALLREDGSPPLYYALLHVWMQLFGRGELATHMLSLGFAVLAVPIAYWAGASTFDRRTGAYCAVLAAALPFLSSYAQETRMYSLLVLLSIVLAASFVQLFVFRRRRHLPVFVASLAAILYTHNWGLFLALAAFGAFLLCVHLSTEQRRSLLRDGALAFGITALLYLPWVPTLLYQARHTGAPWAIAPVVWSLSQGFYFIVGGRGAAVALLLAGGSGLLALRVAARRDRAIELSVISLLVLAVGTILIAWLNAKSTPSWAFRYLAVVVGPLLVVTGFGLARAAGLGLAALALVCCFWVLNPVPHSLDAKSNVESAAAVVRHELGPNALVLSTQPEQVPTLAYYLPAGTRFATPLGPVSDPRVMDWRNALARFRLSSVRGVLAPLLTALTPGERLGLVEPTTFARAPTWMNLIRKSSLAWSRYLYRDRNLRLLAVTTRAAHHAADAAVRFAVYVVKD